MTQTQPTLKGVIYVATGPDYLDLAVTSARSLRVVEPDLAIDLYTDLTQSVPTGLFTEVYEICDPHPRSKLDCMAKTRFDRTLFLDSDTLVTAPLGDLFDVLDRFDLALAHEVCRATDLIRATEGTSKPYAFPQFNSGVLLYRRSPVMLDFLATWAERFRTSGGDRDQPILKDLLWTSDIRFLTLPPEFNLRRLTILDAWEPGDAIPTILHTHRIMDHMRGAGPGNPDAHRLDTPAALVQAERVAHAEEWERAGGRAADPIRRFDVPPPKRS